MAPISSKIPAVVRAIRRRSGVSSPLVILSGSVCEDHGCTLPRPPRKAPEKPEAALRWSDISACCLPEGIAQFALEYLARILARQIVTQFDELGHLRSEEHTSELQSLMRISYAVFCLKQKNIHKLIKQTPTKIQ